MKDKDSIEQLIRVNVPPENCEVPDVLIYFRRCGSETNDVRNVACRRARRMSIALMKHNAQPDNEG